MGVLDTIKREYAKVGDELLGRKRDGLEAKKNELERLQLRGDVLDEIATSLPFYRDEAWVDAILDALRATTSEKGNVRTWVDRAQMTELVFQHIVASDGFSAWLHDRVQQSPRYSAMEPAKRDAAVAKLDDEIRSLEAEIARRRILRDAARAEALVAGELEAVAVQAGGDA
jgi:hypothetical protein